MATTVTVFDPVSRNTKTISVDIRASVLEGDMSGKTSYFFTMGTNAVMVSGDAIPAHVITQLSDLALGTHWANGSTTGNYTNMTVAIQDHVRLMVEGTPGDATTKMKFTA